MAIPITHEWKIKLDCGCTPPPIPQPDAIAMPMAARGDKLWCYEHGLMTTIVEAVLQEVKRDDLTQTHL